MHDKQLPTILLTSAIWSIFLTDGLLLDAEVNFHPVALSTNLMIYIFGSYRNVAMQQTLRNCCIKNRTLIPIAIGRASQRQPNHGAKAHQNNSFCNYKIHQHNIKMLKCLACLFLFSQCIKFRDT